MSRQCQITKKKRSVGYQYCIRGIAKKKGGIGLKVTGKSRRLFLPNVFKKRFWHPAKKCFVTLKLSAAALRTINKKGLLAVLNKGK